MSERPIVWPVVRWWLERRLPAHVAPDVLGDLLEDFADEQQRGRLHAELWLLREAWSLSSCSSRPGLGCATRLGHAFQIDLGPEKPAMPFAFIAQQCRFAIRALARTPVFTVISVMTLALGIGATTAVYSVMRQVLLDPLPYPNANRLVAIAETRRDSEISVSYQNFEDWRKAARSFESLALFEGTSFTLPGVDGAERVRAQYVGPDLLHTLGTTPSLGRAFTGDEQRAGGRRVVMIGDGFWRRRFGADPAVLSRRLQLDANTYDIVGVLPPGFDFPSGIVYSPAEIYLPLGVFLADNQDDIANRNSHPGLEAIGLLRPGVPMAAAREELKGIASRLEVTYPASNRDIGVSVQDAVTAIVGDLKGQLTLVLAGVGLVLLIACANVAGLALARAASRSHERSVQAALGARRWHVATSLLAESAIVSAAGGLLGLGLAAVLLRVIAPAVVDLPRLSSLSISWRMLGASAAISAFTAIACALLPALWTTRSLMTPALRQRGGATAVRGRRVLVCAQMALALMLLLMASTLVTALARMAADHGGVNADSVLTFDIRLPGQWPTARTTAFFTTLNEQLRAMPGVTSAGSISTMPFSGGGAQSDMRRLGDGIDQGVRTDVSAITPDYFSAMGVPLLRGRAFSTTDAATAPDVTVIDETFAARFWPGQDPIGRHVEGWGHHDLLVVGIAGHVKNYGVNAPSREELYVPLAQHPRSRMFTAIRATTDPAALSPAVRRVVASIDPTVAVANVQTMRRVVDATIAGTRVSSMVSAGFAVAALSLALIGMAGLVGYLVELRRREIGVRLALGAEPLQVVMHILTGAVRLSAVGIAVGLTATFALMPLLRSWMASVGEIAPLQMASVTAALLAVTLAASWLPARRAARVPLTSVLED